LKKPQIAFIGAGNMASSIIGGLVEAGHPASKICAAGPNASSLARLQSIAPVSVSVNNVDAVSGADVIILAVKPQIMAEAAASIASAVKASGAVTMSIAAGVTIASMEKRLGSQAAIVRCMPNTPALIGCGASALFANPQVSDLQRTYTDQILAAVGITAWVDTEAELDAITALSGSGPAYFFLFMEAMIDAGEQLGLSKATATSMAMQTALGASRMAQESDVDLAELRNRVTSPGGTTERAVQAFERGNLRKLVKDSMQEAADRAAELAEEMG
jgi:pyrroline-5-carboxylate reductase